MPIGAGYQNRFYKPPEPKRDKAEDIVEMVQTARNLYELKKEFGPEISKGIKSLQAAGKGSSASAITPGSISGAASPPPPLAYPSNVTGELGGSSMSGVSKLLGAGASIGGLLSASGATAASTAGMAGAIAGPAGATLGMAGMGGIGAAAGIGAIVPWLAPIIGGALILRKIFGS